MKRFLVCFILLCSLPALAQPRPEETAICAVTEGAGPEFQAAVVAALQAQ